MFVRQKANWSVCQNDHRSKCYFNKKHLLKETEKDIRKEERKKKEKKGKQFRKAYSIQHLKYHSSTHTNHASIRILYLALVSTFSEDVKNEMDLKKSNKND